MKSEVPDIEDFEKLDYLHHFLQEIQTILPDDDMVKVAIGFVEELRESRFDVSWAKSMYRGESN